MNPTSDFPDFDKFMGENTTLSVENLLHGLKPSNKEDLDLFYMKNNISLLTIASLTGEEDIVSTILTISTGNIDKGYQGGHNAAPSPLHVAIIAGQLGIVQLLVEAGANININTWVMPPIMVALVMQDMEIFDYLLDAGADVNIREREREKFYSKL